MDASRDRQQQANVATCISRGSSTGLRWAGWRAYRIEDPDRVEPPTVVFCCPACTDRGAIRAG